MSNIFMDIPGTKSKANKLQATGKKVISASDVDLSNVLGSVPSVWTGDGATRYQKKLKKLNARIRKRGVDIQNTGNSLMAAAERMEKVENAAMSIFSKLICILLVGVCMMEVTGCGEQIMNITHEEVAKEALANRYEKEFEIEEVTSAQLADGYFTVKAYDEENPDLPFRAHVNNDGNGVADNYVSRILCEKLSDQVAKNFDGLDGIYYIYSAPYVDLPNLTDTTMSIEQMVEKNPYAEFMIYVNFVPNENDMDNLYENLQKAMKGLECIEGNLFLYICDETMLGRIQNYFTINDRIYNDYTAMTERYFVGMFPIKDGKVTLDKTDLKNP